jgi:murein DD-endopeptidase MepM/ murein hydrolase activator NlpD
MRAIRMWSAAAALSAALAVFAPLSDADTFSLTSPSPATCVTDGGAVFTVEAGALKPVRGQFMIFPPGAQALHPRTGISVEGQPGELLRMYLWSSEPLDSFTVQIGIPGKSILTKTAGFRSDVCGGTEMWAALAGLPSWGAAGEYTVTATATSGKRSYLFLQPFAVIARTFFAERIPLNTGLTDLVTVPDAQKREESRILAEVLSTPHPDALYDTGKFTLPIRGRRSSGYGDRREYDYSDGTKGYAIHLGVDIPSPIGTPVPSCGKGRVVFSDNRILTGNTVVIEHLPGLFSVYYHLFSIAVRTGDVVEQGQVIGAVGMTGFATGPHLHWEVDETGVAVDPDALVGVPLLDKNTDFFDIEAAHDTEGR